MRISIRSDILLKKISVKKQIGHRQRDRILSSKPNHFSLQEISK